MSAGCVGTNDDEDEEDEESSAQNTDPENTDSDPGVEPNTDPESDGGSNSGSNSNNNSDNDSDSSGGEHDEPPSDEETQPEGDYDEEKSGGQRELSERPSDDATIVDGNSTSDGYGGATTTLTVENTSDTTIDVVDISIVYYDQETDEQLYSDSLVVRDLAAGDQEQVEHQVEGDYLTENPRVDVTATPYDDGAE